MANKFEEQFEDVCLKIRNAKNNEDKVAAFKDAMKLTNSPLGEMNEESDRLANVENAINSYLELKGMKGEWWKTDDEPHCLEVRKALLGVLEEMVNPRRVLLSKLVAREERKAKAAKVKTAIAKANLGEGDYFVRSANGTLSKCAGQSTGEMAR